jgi:nucleotide-binding universal stress UspA family protein
MILERIVCGVDGSPESLEGLRQAIALRSPESRIVALTVCELSLATHAGFEAARAAAQLLEDGRAAREASAQELTGVPFCEARLVEGRAIPALPNACERERATLLVLGSHGWGRAAGILLGSIATTMLHQAPCPVLIARAPTTTNAFPRSIAVGVDGSSPSLEAEAFARSLAERLAVSLRVVVAQGGKPIDIEGLRGIKDLQWDDLRPVDALVAASAGTDLLVLGSRGLHGLDALGSVSERVAHEAKGSVLVVRPFAYPRDSETSAEPTAQVMPR